LILLISNYDEGHARLKCLNYDQYIFFNPWGFSKKSLKYSFNRVLKKVDGHEKIELNLYFENKFFGNRVQYVYEYISSNNKWKKVKLIKS